MKKNILLIITVIICVIFMTACFDKSKEEKIELKDSKLKLKTVLEYNKDEGFKKEKDVTGGKYAEVEFSNEKENLYFDMYYSKSSKETSKSVKEDRKNNKYYKEYKYNGYEAYAYSEFKDNINLVLTIKNENKDTIELFIAITSIKYEKEKVLFDIFDKSKVIQEFFESIKITEE